MSGIRSAPGTPAAVAICFGRLFAPWNPPPTNPLRMLVTRKMSSSSVEQRLRSIRDVVEAVAPQEDRDVVLLETRPGRVAGEADRVGECANGLLLGSRRALVDGQVSRRLPRDVAIGSTACPKRR